MPDTIVTISGDQNTLDWFWKYAFPIITLIIGAIIAIGSQKFLNWLERKKTKKYLVYSLTHLINSINEQIKYIENFNNKLEQKPDEIPQMEFKAGFHLKNIDIISRNDLYDIFVLKNGGKEKENSESLNNFLDTLEILTVNINFINNDLIELAKINYDQKLNFNEKYNSLRNVNNNKIQKHLNTPISTELNQFELEKLKKQVELTSKIYELNKFFYTPSLNRNNIFGIYDEYLKPLEKLSNEYNDIELSAVLPEILNLCESFIASRENYIESFKLINESLKLVSQNLKNTHDFLN